MAVNVTEVGTVVLLAVAVAICAASGLAIVAMPGFFAKLHFLAPPAVLATSAVAAAVLLSEGLSAAGMKTLLVLAVMVISNPVVTYTAARAHLLRTQRDEPQGGK
jgi:multisubunit Na+/H+ antiporter MnhG subunit